jgi:hypothetical protein
MKQLGTIAVLFALTGVGNAWAAPLDLKNVPADAKWLVHVDVDAARSSSVVQKFVEQCGKDLPRAKERLVELCEKLGLNQCKDLHGITAFSEKLEPKHGVLIADAKWNAKRLQEFVDQAPDHKVIEDGAYKIHTFTAHKGTKHAHSVAATVLDSSKLVLASSPEMLKSALQVLEGKAPAIAGKQSPLAATVPSGTIFLARAVDVKDSAVAKMRPVLQLIKSFDYAKGQRDGQWFGNVTVTAESKSVAEKLGQVFEGYRAWLSLHAYKDRWFGELLNKAKLTVDGNVVRVAFLEPADTLTAHMPELCRGIHEHVAMMKRHCEAMKTGKGETHK